MAFFKRSKKDEAKPAEAMPAGRQEKDKKAEVVAKMKAAAPAAPEKKAEEKKPEAPRETGESYRVLLRPLVTEKSAELGKYNKYVFVVARTANKIEIRRAVKRVYGVEPVDVTVSNVLGKSVRTRRGYVRRNSWRKAVVTLKSGDRIDLFANA